MLPAPHRTTRCRWHRLLAGLLLLPLVCTSTPVPAYALRAGLEGREKAIAAELHASPATTQPEGRLEEVVAAPILGLEGPAKAAVVVALKTLRRNLIDPKFLLSLYQDVSHEMTDVSARPGVGRERELIPKLVLAIHALPVDFPETITHEAQEAVSQQLQKDVFPLLPHTITFSVHPRGSETRKLRAWKREVLEANVARSIPFPKIYDAINRVIRLADPVATMDLSEEERIEFVMRLHEEAYQRIHRARGAELFGPGHYVYTQTHPVTALAMIRQLVAQGYLGPTKKFVDLGCGDGFVGHLVNAMTGGRATGVEIDNGLLMEARSLTGQLSNKGVVDGNRVRWILGNYLQQNLAQFDVLYTYPSPMPEDFELVAGNLNAVAEKMKPGAILITGGIGQQWGGHLDKSPYVKYDRKIGGYRRIISFGRSVAGSTPHSQAGAEEREQAVDVVEAQIASITSAHPTTVDFATLQQLVESWTKLTALPWKDAVSYDGTSVQSLQAGLAAFLHQVMEEAPTLRAPIMTDPQMNAALQAFRVEPATDQTTGILVLTAAVPWRDVDGKETGKTIGPGAVLFGHGSPPTIFKGMVGSSSWVRPYDGALEIVAVSRADVRAHGLSLQPTAGAEEGVAAARAEAVRQDVSRELALWFQPWWIRFFVIPHRNLQLAVGYDSGSTRNSKDGPSLALVRGRGGDWWIHLHLLRRRGPVDSLSNGLLARLKIAQQGTIVGIADIMVESEDPSPYPRGFVPLEGALSAKQLGWLSKMAWSAVRNYAGVHEQAIRRNNPDSSILAKADGVDLYQMLDEDPGPRQLTGNSLVIGGVEFVRQDVAAGAEELAAYESVAAFLKQAGSTQDRVDLEGRARRRLGESYDHAQVWVIPPGRDPEGLTTVTIYVDDEAARQEVTDTLLPTWNKLGATREITFTVAVYPGAGQALQAPALGLRAARASAYDGLATLTAETFEGLRLTLMASELYAIAVNRPLAGRAIPLLAVREYFDAHGDRRLALFV